ncbi:MAG: HNH endonuclease [Treponemataceae bacterium]
MIEAIGKLAEANLKTPDKNTNLDPDKLLKPKERTQGIYKENDPDRIIHPKEGVQDVYKENDPDKLLYPKDIRDSAFIEDNAIKEQSLTSRNEHLAGKTHPETGVPFEKRNVIIDGKEEELTVPKFDSIHDVQLPEDKTTASDKVQNQECNKQLKEAVEKDPSLKEKFTKEQLEQIENGDTPDGYTWHHDTDVGKMQLVDSKIHAQTGHTGGKQVWGGGSQNR